MKYKVYVWYRFVIAGEQEKDYMDFEIEADSPKEAAIKSKEKFKSFAKIPFSIECDGLTFKPNNIPVKYIDHV